MDNSTIFFYLCTKFHNDMKYPLDIQKLLLTIIALLMTIAINSQQYAQMEAENPSILEQVEGDSYGSQIKGHYGREPSGKITMLHLKRLKWGNYSFHDLHCSTINGLSHVGAPLLHYGTLIINPFKKRLIFQPYNGLDSCIIGNSRLEHEAE